MLVTMGLGSRNVVSAGSEADWVLFRRVECLVIRKGGGERAEERGRSAVDGMGLKSAGR